MNLVGSSKFICQEIYMYDLVNVNHNSMVVLLNRSDCEGFYEVLYIQCSGWD